MRNKEEVINCCKNDKLDLVDILYGNKNSYDDSEEISLEDSQLSILTHPKIDKVRPNEIANSEFGNSGVGPRIAVASGQSRLIQQTTDQKSYSELLCHTYMEEPIKLVPAFLQKKQEFTKTTISQPMPPPHISGSERKKKIFQNKKKSMAYIEKELVVRNPTLPPTRWITLNPQIDHPISQLSDNEKYLFFLEALHNPSISLSEKKELLMMPLPKFWAPLGCHIKIDTSGLTKKFYPKYYLYINLLREPLLAAQKMNIFGSAYYLITVFFNIILCIEQRAHKCELRRGWLRINSTMEKDNVKKTAPGYLGKIISNYRRTEYNLFDKGENPQKKVPLSNIQNQLGAVLFESNIILSKDRRRMHILIPEIHSNSNPYNWKPLAESEYMIPRFKALFRAKMHCFTNKAPKWSPSEKAYILNFQNPEIKASEKNFKIIDPLDPDFFFIQCGLVGKNTFSLELRFPFSLFQAFCEKVKRIIINKKEQRLRKRIIINSK